jgi:3-oxoacyl-[acyl-carrier protein] reductase
MNLALLKIIITGGARGLSAHFAQQLVRAGAQVTVGDANEEALALLPDEIKRRPLNVTSESDVASFVNWASEEMSGLNALINNAGTLQEGLLVKRDKATGEVTTLTLDQIRNVIDINLTGATLVVREVVSYMAKWQVPGVVVNISSFARHGHRGPSTYASAKAALIANTIAWSREFAPLRIRVAAVAPGMIETPLTLGMNARSRESLIEKIPVGRIGVPEDIWLAVKFALECDYFNGRCVDVDGGLV